MKDDGKLRGGEWLTFWEALRWKLIRLLLRPGDAALLANGLYSEITASRLIPYTSDERRQKIEADQNRRRQIYYVLRWMQRRESPVNHPQKPG